MLDLCVNDLYNKVQALPLLASSTGLTIGGKVPDPSLSRVALPAAWVLLNSGLSSLDAKEAVVSANLPALISFAVLLHVAYLGQQDLITNQIPLLESVIKAVHGTQAPSYQRWRFQTFKLVSINTDRMVYRIEFLLDVGSL